MIAVEVLFIQEVVMSLSRRLFITSLVGLATLGRSAIAQEKGPLAELLSNVSDRSLRDFMEKHDRDGRWDGHYYYDRQNDKRYTRDEWRKELEWRYKQEKEGRDWRRERYGKDFKDRRDRNDERDRKHFKDDRKPPKDKKNDKRKPASRAKDKKNEHRKPPRQPKDKRPEPRRDD